MGLINFINSLILVQQSTVVRNLDSIDALTPIEADYGTAFEDLDLPATATGNFSDGSSEDVVLEWLEGIYNTVNGTYTLYANVAEGSYTNLGNIQAQIVVTVNAQVIDPATLSPFVFIDAEDYAVGAISNGTTLTNHGSGGGAITVVGTTLSVQVNADGKKEFVCDGSTHLLCDTQNAFAFMHNGTGSDYTVQFIGKIGTTSNPDAAYFLFGNLAGSSTSIGMSLTIENRAAQSATRGAQFIIGRGVSSSLPINSRNDVLTFNTRKSYVWTLQMNGILMNHNRMFDSGDLMGVHDRIRTTSNTTSGLGTAIAFSSSNPTNKFQILSGGTGTFRLVGKMEKFMIYPSVLNKDQIRGVDAFCDIPADYGKAGSTCKYIKINQTLTNGAPNNYALGGLYAKNTSKTRTNFITSIGPDHFEVGSDRKIMQSVSLDDGFTFPAYTELFASGTVSPQGGPAGGYTPTGRLLLIYGQYTSATGVYTGPIIVKFSGDDGVTWNEFTATLPVTSPVLTGWNVLDKPEVCDNGDVVITMYAASGTSLYNVYVMRTSDNGATWTFNLITTSPTAYKNESSVVNLGGGNMLVATRVEAIDTGFFKHEFFSSSDHGVTWSSIGTRNYGTVYAHPPVLRRFDLDGSMVIAFYYVDRGTRKCFVVYATAAAWIASGLTALTGRTVYTLDNRLYGANLGWESGYPTVIHPDNDLKAEGIYSEESTNNSVCTINFFKIDDEHKAKIKAELGI